MSLNPLRSVLGQSGLRAFESESKFKAEADAAQAGFQAARNNLEHRVRQGDLTLKVARELAAVAAADLKSQLMKKAENYSSVPRVFLERLVEANLARENMRKNLTIEGLQRETNRLLRETLIEQQIQNRAVEFQGKTYLRSLSGGLPAPTIDSLLAFHTMAQTAGDEPALEWSRRQLEGMRNRVLNADDLQRIDEATDRPDHVNPRFVARYVEVMEQGGAEELEVFVSEALASQDANACIAAFVLARQAPEGSAARWVRTVLGSLNQFPDPALTTLRAWEADARRAEAEAASAQAEYAIALAEADAGFPGLEPPTEAELAQRSRLLKKPVAQFGEPVGLTLERRGLTPEDFEVPTREQGPFESDDPETGTAFSF